MPPDPDLDRSDPTFVDDLRTSDEWVWRAARWLRDRYERPVTVMPVRVRPSVSQMSNYSDHGDLYIGRRRIEVKHRQLDFQSAVDFPFPTITVDVAHAWDHADPKPVLYLLYNKSGTVLALVKGGSAHQWERVRKLDRVKGRERTFLECPVALVSFVHV